MIDVELCASHSLREPLDAILPPLPRAEAIPETVQTLKDSSWMMTFGERAALEGLLSQLAPTLALEIGAGLGGSLKRLAAHSARSARDRPRTTPRLCKELANVHWHKGDSHMLLPRVACPIRRGRTERRLRARRRRPHAGGGSPGHGGSTRLAGHGPYLHPGPRHHERGRALGARAGRLRADSQRSRTSTSTLFPGVMFRAPVWRYQLWGGLGLIVVDAGSLGNDGHAGPLLRGALADAQGEARDDRRGKRDPRSP